MYNFRMKPETPLLKNLSDRLNYVLRLTGTKKADLARSISVKPQIIQFLCNSKTQTSRFTFEIATVLGLNTGWLATGEGAMFIADDPKQQFLKTYKSIPLLRADTIRDAFLYENKLQQEWIQAWFPLKTTDHNTFAIEMNDTSMEPYFPLGSYVFVKKCSKKNLGDHKYIFSYLVKFDTFLVRELISRESEQILAPKNKELFKEIKVTDDVHLLGVITDCFWHIRG